MEKRNRVVGYVRLSFDEDKQNYDSIINQKSIIRAYAKKHLGQEDIIIYEDDNFSGYKFNRPSFVKMRHSAEQGEVDVILAKDLSRLGRHNARTLLFIEEMQEFDVRVICINDDMDTMKSGYDDIIGVKTWANERVVKDASNKVRRVISHKQEEGTWICAVPYGYEMIDAKKQVFDVDPQGAEIVKQIFELYLSGWGYKKIANYLTDNNIPTPRMLMKQRKEAKGEECRLKTKKEWSIITVSEILCNDFYIGTLRTSKYTRKTINGNDVKKPEEDNFVFENNHEAIVDGNIYKLVQEQLKLRSTGHYRGIKKHDNVYSGLLVCGDCKSPMFSISNAKRPNAYTCGLYHRRGLKGCTSHHILEETLNNLVRNYIKRVKENSLDIIDELNKSLKKDSDKEEKYNIISILEKEHDNAREELKGVKKQKVREAMKPSADLETIDEIYKEIEEELIDKISGLQSQINNSRKINKDVKRIKEIGIDAIKIFDKILAKDRFTRKDLEFIISKIFVYEDTILIQLKADIETIFTNSNGKEKLEKSNSEIKIEQIIPKHSKKLFTTNVICEGDPLEIFTDREGEIILKKYSPIGELGTFAKEYAESLSQAAGHITCIVDKDQIIAVSGGAKKDFYEKNISSAMEKCINSRNTVVADRNDKNFVPVLEDDVEGIYNYQLITPIISEGDVLGAIVFLSHDKKMGEVEGKLAQTAAGFLGKQMEQ